MAPAQGLGGAVRPQSAAGGMLAVVAVAQQGLPQ